MSKGKADQCGVCNLRVKANSGLCAQCGKWIHGRCTVVKRMTAKFSRNCACTKNKENIGEAVKQEETLYEICGIFIYIIYIYMWKQ